MLTIRLIRTGKKNTSTFRIVLIEKKSAPKSGKSLEILGNYNPRLSAKQGKEINLKEDRIKYWLSQGVQTSETVHNLLIEKGIIKGDKIKKNIKTKKKVIEEETKEVSEEKPKEEKPEEKLKDESKEKEDQPKKEEVKDENKEKPKKEEKQVTEDKK
ncbi:MAG: 30S ribosomal protein S16 [Candidatus Portnoybacteria bacterium]|nr:30S ribosomal protein S16 [Candidatus Portnoybacteria bacterium]